MFHENKMNIRTIYNEVNRIVDVRAYYLNRKSKLVRCNQNPPPSPGLERNLGSMVITMNEATTVCLSQPLN